MTRLLVAEDDDITARRLRAMATSWGYQVETAADGHDAVTQLSRDTPPDLALVDWMLPGIEGPEICRRVRALDRRTRPYIIILTGRTDRADVVAGLEAGADEYLVKPFDTRELRARLHAGARIITLERNLAAHARELEEALASVRRLKGLLPICSYCKSIRDDSDYWHRVESYIGDHADVQFTHGICPSCIRRVFGDLADHKETASDPL